MKPSSSSSASPLYTLSSVTVAVDKATSGLLLTPDWTMVISICDSLNANRWQCKDAIKAVKRRLQHKSSRVQLLTLTLLEAMLKNCGDFVHSHIAQKHVLEDMVKIVVRNKCDFQVKTRILILLDTWNEAFHRNYPHYNWAYKELSRSGVKFPERTKEAPLMLPSSSTSSSLNSMSIGLSRRLDETMATEIEGLSLSNLESMRNVMDLVSDMVQALNPSDKSAIKDELLVDLVEQCRSNQKKLIQMVTTTTDEDVMARGLELNDSLQVVLARHDAIASVVSLPLLQAPQTRQIDDVDVDAAATLESDESSSSSSSEGEIDKGEQVKNDFMQLAPRHALLSSQHSDEEEETLLLGNNNNEEIDQAKTQCKDLALVDTTATQSEQDIIELLSLTLSTTAMPSSQTQTQTQTQPPPNTSFFADDHVLMNSYVVPWAQSQTEPQVPKMAQYAPLGPQFQPQPQPQQQQQCLYSYHQPQPQPQQQQCLYSYHQPQWNGGQTNSNETALWSGGERNLHYSNARAATGPSEVVVDGQPQRQYVPPYKLFEDLNVFWNADGGVRSTK